MRKLLSLAGAQKQTIDEVDDIIDTCSVCREWARRPDHAVHSNNITTMFNECVQVDLLFLAEGTVLHCVDTTIKWSVAAFIKDRSTEEVLRTLTHIWLRQYGPPATIVSDQEGALSGDAARLWASRWGLVVLLRPRQAHANIVERAHDVVRGIYLKIRSQTKAEGLICTPEEILDEAILAKNTLVGHGRQSPFEALYGRSPFMLRDFTGAGAVTTDDETGAAGTRHIHRLRELAVQALVAHTAQARLRLAMNSRTRPAGETMGLKPGDLIDFYRDPPDKSSSGWRGPAAVASIDRLSEGVIE
eukprot:6481320-Amphidinium_carterae.1